MLWVHLPHCPYMLLLMQASYQPKWYEWMTVIESQAADSALLLFSPVLELSPTVWPDLLVRVRESVERRPLRLPASVWWWSFVEAVGQRDSVNIYFILLSIEHSMTRYLVISLSFHQSLFQLLHLLRQLTVFFSGVSQ